MPCTRIGDPDDTPYSRHEGRTEIPGTPVTLNFRCAGEDGIDALPVGVTSNADEFEHPAQIIPRPIGHELISEVTKDFLTIRAEPKLRPNNADITAAGNLQRSYPDSGINRFKDLSVAKINGGVRIGTACSPPYHAGNHRRFFGSVKKDVARPNLTDINLVRVRDDRGSTGPVSAVTRRAGGQRKCCEEPFAVLGSGHHLGKRGTLRNVNAARPAAYRSSGRRLL